jgi:hypothetical protein
MTKNSTTSRLDQQELTVDDRLDHLERVVFRLDADINDLAVMVTELSSRIRHAQEISAKVVQAQNRIHEYISHWPFVRVVKNGKDIS